MRADSHQTISKWLQKIARFISWASSRQPKPKPQRKLLVRLRVCTVWSRYLNTLTKRPSLGQRLNRTSGALFSLRGKSHATTLLSDLENPIFGTVHKFATL